VDGPRRDALPENEARLPAEPPPFATPRPELTWGNAVTLTGWASSVLRLRRVLGLPNGWEYEGALTWLDKPLLKTLASSGAQSAGVFARRIHRRAVIRTTPERTGIRAMTEATASDWLTSAWRRGLVEPLSVAPGGWDTGLVGPLWTITDVGRRRLRSPVAALVRRFPVARAIPIATAAAGGIYAWAGKHTDVLRIAALYVGLAAAYGLLLWVVATVINTRLPRLALVSIETSRANGDIPPLLDARPPEHPPEDLALERSTGA
jgi:hypothetical protein